LYGFWDDDIASVSHPNTVGLRIIHVLLILSFRSAILVISLVCLLINVLESLCQIVYSEGHLKQVLTSWAIASYS